MVDPPAVGAAVEEDFGEDGEGLEVHRQARPM